MKTEIEIDEKVLNVKESATLAINQAAKKLIKEGKTVYHWGFGQSPFPISMPIQNELKNRSDHKEYLPTLGLEQLRKTLSEYYSQEYDLQFASDNFFIGPGSKELIFQMLYLLKGKFIIVAPSCVSYGAQREVRGDSPHYIITKRENNYKLTAAEIEEQCTNLGNVQKTLILNSPSNPTGQYYSVEELKELSAVLRKHKVIVISDEIYGLVNFNKKITPSLASYYPERTIITGGLSKAHSAGGYRLGYMIIPEGLKDTIKPLKALISETFSAVAAPIQYAAIKAWDKTKEVEDDIKLATSIHKACAHYFYERLSDMGIDCPAPQGAFYLFISFIKYKNQLENLGIKTNQELCKYLLEKYQIALLPGDDFYYPIDSLTARLAFVDYNGKDVMNAAKKSEQLNKQFIEKYCPNVKNGLDVLNNFLDSIS